ncbi:unnamed protein product [Sphagnum troendelagicum]|uniref:Plastid lipid-associated protein/fibrillin conserved domain-containing protein n=1 Tax=Sphagnum troendelagicum TaxID=128251 RepID=A0ABP0V3U8_9BRYO
MAAISGAPFSSSFLHYRSPPLPKYYCTTWRSRTSFFCARAIGEASVSADYSEAKRLIDEVLRKGKEEEEESAVAAAASSVANSAVSWALYCDKESQRLLAESVEKLCASSQDAGPFLSSENALGVWDVFYAPHISRISKSVGVNINPLRYILSPSGFVSNVQYMSPFGDGWLSAAGDFVVRDNQTVEVLFDSFWWDIGRDSLQPDPKGQGSVLRTMVNVMGKGAFIQSLSAYPVHFADEDIVVFEFTPLKTKIAARKTGNHT